MFITVEFQKSAQDTVSCLVNAYQDRSDAEQQYHDVLRYASKTTLLKHGCTLLTEAGDYIKNEAYGDGETNPDARIVIEFQKTSPSAISPIVNYYTDASDAEVRYHTILTFAPKTTLAKHGGIMLREDGSHLKAEWYGTDAREAE